MGPAAPRIGGRPASPVGGVDAPIGGGEDAGDSDEDQVARADAEKPAVVNDRLGLIVADLTTEQRNTLGMAKDGGVLVKEVAPGPAKSAGIRAGDVILMMNGRKVSSAEEFRDHLNKLPAGKSVAMLVHKEEGPVFIALRIPQ